jgi:hypothetical protein
VDALNEVADEYDFLEPGDGVWSRGSATREWVAHTFTEKNLDEIRRTAVVTGNSSSRWGMEEEHQPYWPHWAKKLTNWQTVSVDDFLTFDEVWRYVPMNPYVGTLLPHPVTDRAISVWREFDPERMIVHYIQPHHPYHAGSLKQNRPASEVELNPWRALKNGVPREEVWSLYLDDLRLGLDSVSTLVEDIDAEDIVITADHGDAFGEFGIYSHPMLPLPALRRVPWVETSGRGRGTYTPMLERGDAGALDTDHAHAQLEALGYR